MSGDLSPDHGRAPVTDRLAGKVAIVCGAGQTPGSTIGNGVAMATLFGRAGAHVVCVDREQERAESTAAGIRSQGGRAGSFHGDITVADDVAGLVAAVLEDHGRIDVLVNNVGVGGGDGPVDRLSEDRFDQIMRINLKGAWLTTRTVFDSMREQRGGSIVNISSLASMAGSHMMAYEVSKAAMNRMTTATALRGAKHHVRCNAILPGLLDTPMAIRGISQSSGVSEDELRERRAATVPSGQMGNGWDTAYAALFLASDESRFVNGVCLRVDGGQGARIG